jgi:anthranilate phosphoribosyltransferase
MVVGYVFIDAVPSKEFAIYTQLLEMPQIKDVHIISGQYDLIAKVEFDTYKQLTDFITEQIRVINGIVSTKTAPEAYYR